ncbi:MAG: hypothetical protein QM621_14955 [Aeromicrobium sp.]|uniref:hypothetical protein n=1 Tax=Aeromicrobium sp. TaxID=1871063 RepID=UPI0039E6089A
MTHHRWAFGDLATGRIRRLVDDVDGSWSVAYDDADSLDVSIRTRAVGPRRQNGVVRAPDAWPDVRLHTAPARCFCAVAAVDDRGGETWLAGGPVWSRQYDDDTGVLRVGAAGLESYWRRRLVLPVLATGQLPTAVRSRWTGAQLGLIAKRLIQQAQEWTGGALPVDLPTDAEVGGAGTAHERTYEGFELKVVGDMLDNLRDVEGGPEVQFVPYRRTDDPRYLRWRMRVGVAATQMMITQTGRPWILDRTVGRSPVLAVSTGEDGSVLASDVYATGSGDGQARPMARAASTTLTAAGYPLLEAVATGSDAITPANLSAYAAGQLGARSAPAQITTIKADRDAWWRRAPSARPGDMAILRIADHPLLAPDGAPAEIPLRILGLKGGGSTVDVATAERAGRL